MLTPFYLMNLSEQSRRHIHWLPLWFTQHLCCFPVY